MNAFTTWLHNEKKWLIALVAGLVAGAAAAGFVIPEGLVTFVNGIVNGL